MGMQNKTGKTAIAVAALAALGTVGKSWIDARGSDKLQTVVAGEVARNNQRWQAIERLIEAQDDDADDITALREAVAALKVSVELLSRNRNLAAREAAGGAEIPEQPKVVKAKSAGMKPPSSMQVQQVRDKLFNGD